MSAQIKGLCNSVSDKKKKFLNKLCYFKLLLFYDKQLLFIMFISTLITQMAIHGQTFSKRKHSLFKISKHLEVRHFQSYGQWVKAIGTGVSYLDEGLGMTVLKLPSTIDSRIISPGEVCGDKAPLSSENSFLKQGTLTCIVLHIRLGKIPTLIKQLKLFKIPLK